MVTATHEVFNDIKAYIKKKGERYQNWYVGTTSDLRSTLFIEHNVSQKQDLWIFRQCSNNRSAKTTKKALLLLGCDGTADGWDELTTTVYAYHKSPGTTP